MVLALSRVLMSINWPKADGVDAGVEADDLDVLTWRLQQAGGDLPLLGVAYHDDMRLGPAEPNPQKGNTTHRSRDHHRGDLGLQAIKRGHASGANHGGYPGTDDGVSEGRCPVSSPKRHTDNRQCYPLNASDCIQS